MKFEIDSLPKILNDYLEEIYNKVFLERGGKIKR